MSFIARINDSFQYTYLGRYFKLEERGSDLTTELNGAVSTFLSMAYILAVNPRILADSGGPCKHHIDDVDEVDYDICIEKIKREYIVGTAIASSVGCFLMGILANLPIALAPGMGMNAYFTYTVVGFRGAGSVSYEAAVTAVLLEGFLFLLLAVTGVRYFLVRLIPDPVITAMPAAIGAFLAHIGLQSAAGIGVVVADISTAVTLGGCPIDKQTKVVAFTTQCQNNSDDCITGDAYTCDIEGGQMSNPSTWLGIFGFMIIATMLCYKQRTAFIAGISFVTIFSWIPSLPFTYFTDDEAGVGEDRFEYFKQIVHLEMLDNTWFVYSSNFRDALSATATFLCVDLLDTTGTLMAIVSVLGFIDDEGGFPQAPQAFTADALATMVGSMFGLSPITSYIESGAGVEAGSRTGLTAIFCGFFFLISIFFAPIIASIPPFAIGGSLIVVGSLMARSLERVQWKNPAHAVPAFLTVMVMPLTYSIYMGLLAGIGSFVFMHSIFFTLACFGIGRPDHAFDIVTGEAGVSQNKRDSDDDDDEDSDDDDDDDREESTQ